MRVFDYEKLSQSQWDVEVINLLAKIHEHKGKQELFLEQKPAVLDKLVENISDISPTHITSVSKYKKVSTFLCKI